MILTATLRGINIIAASTIQYNFTRGMMHEAAMPKCLSPSKVMKHECELMRCPARPKVAKHMQTTSIRISQAGFEIHRVPVKADHFRHLQAQVVVIGGKRGQ